MSTTTGWALCVNKTLTFLWYLTIPCVFAYTGLDAEKMAILAWLFAIDFLSGILKSVLVWHKILSNRMFRGAVKKIALWCVPFIIVLIGKGSGFDISYIANIIVPVFIVAEWYSIIGNIYTIATGKVVTEQDAISRILKNILSLFENILAKADGRGDFEKKLDKQGERLPDNKDDNVWQQ